MNVARLFVLLVLGLVSLGAGCASPLPGQGEGGSESSDSSGTADASGSTPAEADTDVDDTSADPVCGNGIVESGETCDDEVETAMCNANCTLAGCGDGIVNAALGEQCDAGGESALCDDDCTPVTCGDGVVNEAAGEACDGEDLAGGTCDGLGFDVGTLACGVECTYDVSECDVPPDAPVLQLSFSQVRLFDFSWAAVAMADYYRIEESAAPGEPFVQLGGDIVGESVSFERPLHLRWQASYRLWACNPAGCTESLVLDVMGALVDAVGYVKASNAGTSDEFGSRAVLSRDGNTLAVGAWQEDSNATGAGGDQVDDSANDSGAVYVFVRDGAGSWSQQAYLKASNTDAGDLFGSRVALSGDGNALAVGAYSEDSNATGTGGNQADDTASNSGAVYVFVRDGAGVWSQQAYLKASNTDAGDAFGVSVALSEDANTLAVGADSEGSNATGIGGNQADNAAGSSGAVYVFVRDGAGSWSQQAYLKASNTGMSDVFGYSVALSGDGNTLAVGAIYEDSSAMGIGGDQINNNASNSGAVYIFVRNGAAAWSQQAYVKASNTGVDDYFGLDVALSSAGNTLAVGARYEDSNATGIGGNQVDNSASASGAVYVFVRDGAGAWSQQAYVKASNTGVDDSFGNGVALSSDGNTLAVGAPYERSDATGIGGNQADNSAGDSGAVYVFVRNGAGVWSQQAYVKASNIGTSDYFGTGVALSGDSETLAVGAYGEDSNATGVGGNQADDSASASGALYLY